MEDVSELSAKSYIDPMSYEAKYVPKLEIPISARRLRELRSNLATVIPFDHHIHEHRDEHREKAYEVFGTSERTYIEDELEHQTVTTAPLTEYNLHEIEMIESMFRDQDMIKPHFQDKSDQVPIHYCMRYSFMGFLWKILRKCCSWISCIIFF
jgi:hypothetical protein